MKILSVLLCLLPLYLVAQNRYDVVIDEIFADPTPPAGLPNNEWIELKNVSAVPVNLDGWTISDAAGDSGPIPSFELLPDSFVIICGKTAVDALTPFGRVLAVTSFPSLNNDGEQLQLKTAGGRVIHAVDYALSWYGNDLKKEGGWSLEMIDTRNACAGADNWTASTGITGGTPGKKNSIDSYVADETAPELKNAYLKDPQTIILVFDEPVDSFSSTQTINYQLSGGLSVKHAAPAVPFYNKVELSLDAPLLPGIIYTVSARDVVDCRGNGAGNLAEVRTGIPEDPLNGDLIINEVLFNPRANGYDWVEAFNKSRKILDASKIYIANRNSSGAISDPKMVSEEPVYIFPGDYIVMTEDKENLQLNYLVKNAGGVFPVHPMPSYPDDAGDVVLLNYQGVVTDEVKYNKDWHFKLIDHDEGVSLERVSADGPSQDAGNWHSAASTAGYGTPTAVNSQLKQPLSSDATMAITPAIFSPDNDGWDDIASLHYHVGEPGYVANSTIFDAAGRPVRRLVNNAILALQGYWNWDGLNDKGLKLPAGTYIVFTELFNLEGKKKHFKNVIVLAAKFN